VRRRRGNPQGDPIGRSILNLYNVPLQQSTFPEPFPSPEATFANQAQDKENWQTIARRSYRSSEGQKAGNQRRDDK
jgi:hypothetical protein